jgi:hypothetical protein
MHLDGQAVDIERHLTPPMATTHCAQPAAGQLANRLAQDRKVGRLAQGLQQA